MKIIIRVIVFPPVFMILAIAALASLFRYSFLFLRYGGEMTAYTKDDKATIESIYTELKSNRQKLP